MTDSDDTSTLEPGAPAAPPHVPPPVPAYAAHDQPPAHQPRPRFWDRVLGMRGVIAVALACVVLGGVGGAVLGAAANGGDDGFGGPGGPGGFRGGQPGQPGQFQPGQVPQPGT